MSLISGVLLHDGSPAPTHMIGRRFGRYTVTALLGEGGMATVWCARDELLRRQVALKLLREHLASVPEARQRFLHEARTDSQLDHPGIVAVHDYGEAEGTAYIAFSLIDGETLSARVAHSLLPIPEAVRIVSEAADALTHAHAHGVIHRDVTGRNVMVAGDGRVFLLDFGLALAAGQTRLTTADTALGTVTYMAPETIGGGPADERSDLYSLGVVLFEALTGTFPFVADRLETLHYLVVHGEPRRPGELRPDIPPELERFILTALATDPGERPQDAASFAAALRAAVLPADPRPHGVVPPRPAPRSPGASAGMATAGAPIYLAVLPFEDPTPDGEGHEPALGPGIAETLSAVLAAGSGVRVIPPGTAASRRDVTEDSAAVARRVGANLLLTGFLRWAGTRLRVTYSLIDPLQGIPIAGDTVDGTKADIFELEDALARSVRRSLGCEEGPGGAMTRARPRDPAAREHYLQALGYLQRHDDEASLDRAIRLLERLVESEGESADVLASLARAYLAQFRLTSVRTWEGRAAAACQRALALDANAPETLITLGDLHTSAGRPDEAVEEYRRALTLRPESVDAWIGLVGAHLGADRMADAEAAALRAIELHPEDWRGHSFLGLVHFKRSRYARAADAWTRVTQLTPDSAQGHSNLGSAFLHLDRVDEAVAEYRHAIAIHPHPWAYTNLGTALYFAGRYEEAGDAFHRATALAPSDPLMWGNLANACRHIAGHEAEADQAAERAILLMKERLERNPVDALGWGRLAGWLAARGRQAEALRAVERARDLAPDSVQTMARAGSTYFLLGEREQALKCFYEAVRNGYGITNLLRDPELAPLREDPEFRRILGLGPASSEAGA